MKSKKIINVPDNFYEALGFTLPVSPVKIYSSGESVTDYIGEDRVDSLKRESRYKTYYPRLKEINLLTLNYSAMPRNFYQREAYIKKVIRNNIQKNLQLLSPDRALNEKCLNYVKTILSGYSAQVNQVFPSFSQEALVARLALKTQDILCLSFPETDGENMYANPFSSKKNKNGYFCLKSNHSVTAHIISLADFLTEASLLNTLHQIQVNIRLPLVQDIFNNFIQEESESHQIYSDEQAVLKAIRSKAALPASLLFRPYYSGGTKCLYVGLTSHMSSKVTGLFCKILDIYHDIHYENRHRAGMDKTIATAYITKKNIPVKILNAMENTEFKKFFKYVEFDEDVNLSSISTIEKEFKVLNKAYFQNRAFLDVKLRFRKLGKHKASGLYYPSLKTLCVDLRSPSSFIHEYFHMIDDQMGDLSLETDFQEIVSEYKKAFYEGMTQLDASLKEQLHGKGKYNIHYFFRRAEIFARCGEIYFTRIIHVESSLIKPDLTYAYPNSGRLDELIKNYYEALLNVKLAQSGFTRAS